MDNAEEQIERKIQQFEAAQKASVVTSKCSSKSKILEYRYIKHT